MTNVDNMIKKMLGKAKGKPVSKPLSMGMPKMVMPQAMLQRKGASIPMQKQWKSFSKPKQTMLRKRFKDSDGDGVPNRWDCQPHNKFKQDSLFENILPKKKINGFQTYKDRPQFSVQERKEKLFELGRQVGEGRITDEQANEKFSDLWIQEHNKKPIFINGDENLTEEEYKQIDEAYLRGDRYGEGIKHGRQSREKMKELATTGGSWNDMEDFYNSRLDNEGQGDELYSEEYTKGYDEGLGDEEEQKKFYNIIRGKRK